MDTKFPERLHLLLKEAEITQKQLANDMDIPVSTIGGYAQGASEPDFKTLKAIAGYFHVSTDFLLGYTIPGSDAGEEEEILRVYRAVSPKDRELYIAQGRLFIKHKDR